MFACTRAPVYVRFPCILRSDNSGTADRKVHLSARALTMLAAAGLYDNAVHLNIKSKGDKRKKQKTKPRTGLQWKTESRTSRGAYTWNATSASLSPTSKKALTRSEGLNLHCTKCIRDGAATAEVKNTLMAFPDC